MVASIEIEDGVFLVTGYMKLEVGQQVLWYERHVIAWFFRDRTHVVVAKEAFRLLG